jgi:phosphopantetheine--protein transferase-like protein
MIGNDVVDLGDPESDIETHHGRFDKRVFDATERAAIEARPDDGRVRWLLWAAKESAYKAARQRNGSTVFSPRCFAARLHDDGSVWVAAGAQRFRVDATVNAQYVHAVARPADDHADVICTAAIGDASLPPSDAVRALALTTLARAWDVAPDDLCIRRERRIPTLWLRGRRSAADLSLSHHGRFVAFACRVPPAWRLREIAA